MYLQSALEDSRGASHDRSSGWGRLAKAVDTFYPGRPGSNDEEQERVRRQRQRMREWSVAQEEHVGCASREDGSECGCHDEVRLRGGLEVGLD